MLVWVECRSAGGCEVEWRCGSVGRRAEWGVAWSGGWQGGVAECRSVGRRAEWVGKVEWESVGP